MNIIKPTKPGMYIAVTPKLLAIVKIINNEPFLEIKNGINLIDYWKNNRLSLLLESELSHIKMCQTTNKLVLIPLLDSNVYEQFNITEFPLSSIEFTQEDVNNWIEMYRTLQSNGVQKEELINTIMFDGPYTFAQARLIFDYIDKKLKKC